MLSVASKQTEAESLQVGRPAIIEKAREFQKNVYFCFIDYAKAFDYMDHNKLLKILKEIGIPDHFLQNMYSG